MRKVTDMPLVLDRSEVLIYIDQRMHALRLSNRDLANASGVSDQYVNQVLKGKNPVSAKILDGLNKLDPENPIAYRFVVWRQPKE